ncbi:MAG TPA: PIN domain nuclease [Streptosporangiaceae bacterium]|nr:PIN domain nuclease [Streptosporangiaceae bacterium]
MSAALYLIDSSALFRIFDADIRDTWSDALAAGVIAVCPIVELEFLYSARSLADRLEKQQLMRDLFSMIPMHEGGFERAGEVQQRLTESGQHRSAGAVDLLIAATAERERLVILCDDHDYRTVAKVTGQAVRFVTD